MINTLKEEIEQNKRALEKDNIQLETKIKELTKNWG